MLAVEQSVSFVPQGPSLARLPMLTLAGIASFLSLYNRNTLASCSRHLRTTLRAIDSAIAPLATLVALIHDRLATVLHTNDPYISSAVCTHDALCAALSARLLGPVTPTDDLPVGWRYSYFWQDRLTYAGEEQSVGRYMVDVRLEDSRILRLACAVCDDVSASLAASEHDRAFQLIQRSSYFAYIVGEEKYVEPWIYNINIEGMPLGDGNPLFKIISELENASSKLGIPASKLAEYLHRAFPDWTETLKYRDSNFNWVLPPRLPDDLDSWGRTFEENVREIYTGPGNLLDPEDVYSDTFPRLFDLSPDLDRAIDALMNCKGVDNETWEGLLGGVRLLWARSASCVFPFHLAHFLVSAQNSLSSAADAQAPSKRPAPGLLRDSKTFDPVHWARRHINLYPTCVIEVPGQIRRSEDLYDDANTLDRSTRLEMTCSISGHPAGGFTCEFLGEVLNWQGRSKDDSETGILKFGIMYEGIALIESGPVTRRPPNGGPTRVGQRAVSIRFDVKSLAEIYNRRGFKVDFSDAETFGIVLLAACLSGWRSDALDVFFTELNSDLDCQKRDIISRPTLADLARVAETYPWAVGDRLHLHHKQFDIEFVYTPPSLARRDNGFSRTVGFLSEF